MFAKEVRFEGFATEDWARLLALWKRKPSETAPTAPTAHEPPRGGLLVIHRAGRIRKLLHTSLGRLDKDVEVWPTPLPVLAAKYGARWAMAAPAGGLEQLAERWGARVRPADDLSLQLRKLLEILGELSAEGLFELWPNHLDRLLLPPWPLFENTLEAIFPAEHLAFLALFHEGGLWTSLAIERAGWGIRRIVGPDELRPELSFLSGDFRRDYRYALAAAQRKLGPVAFGVFTDLSIFRELQNEKSWSAWLRAVAVRDVILTPPKGSLATPLATDATLALAAAFNSLGRRSESVRLLLSLWQRWR